LNAVTKHRRQKKRVEEWIDYRFRPTAWYVRHSAWQYDSPITGKTEHMGSLDIDLEVRLLEPVKGLGKRRLEVASKPNPTRWGNGILNHYVEEDHDEPTFSGTVWTSDVGALGLLMILLAGRPIELRATGKAFRYRQALVRSFGWHVADHPDREDL
jgi:hypothetical protein